METRAPNHGIDDNTRSFVVQGQWRQERDNPLGLHLFYDLLYGGRVLIHGNDGLGQHIGSQGDEEGEEDPRGQGGQGGCGDTAKEHGEESPDRADALALAFYNPIGTGRVSIGMKQDKMVGVAVRR